MSWIFALFLPIAACLYNGWKAEFPRDRYRWETFQFLLLGIFAAASFLNIASSNPMPLALLSLMMLLLAFLAGAVAGVCCIRWLHTPPGPPGLVKLQAHLELAGVECDICREMIPAFEGKFPVDEMAHHLRLFHPDQYEQLSEDLRS